MDEEENRIEEAMSDVSSSKLEELAGQILKKVGGNEDEACVLVIAGTKERTYSFVDSKPGYLLANAVFNACISDRELMGLLEVSLYYAKGHVAGGAGTGGGNPSAPESKGGES